MQIHIAGHQVDVSDALRGYVEERIANAVSKYLHKTEEVKTTFSKEGHNFRAACSIRAGHGMLLQSHGESVDAYAAFDIAQDRLEKRLRRYKRRLVNHHNSGSGNYESDKVQSFVLADEEETPEDVEALEPIIIAETETEIPTVTVGEAVMRMNLADESVLIFRNRAHGEINVVFRRRDGNVGWIDPAGNSTLTRR